MKLAALGGSARAATIKATTSVARIAIAASARLPRPIARLRSGALPRAHHSACTPRYDWRARSDHNASATVTAPKPNTEANAPARLSHSQPSSTSARIPSST